MNFVLEVKRLTFKLKEAAIHTMKDWNRKEIKERHT